MASLAAPREEGPGREGGPGEEVGWHAMGVLFAFALVVGAYFAFRFAGRWAEVDTALQADVIRAMVVGKTLIPPNGAYYPNGYAFSAVSTFIVALTGVEVTTLLQVLYPVISASLVLIAWPLYRDLLGSERGATLGTLILFIQPEFLFVILRGSHERVLRGLLLISIFLLLRSFRYADRPRLYAAYVFLFYVAVYSTIATNSFFGSSYIWALSVALVGSWFGAYLGPSLYRVSSATRRRLIYVPILCTLLVFVFNNYVYPPAGESLSQVTSIFDRLSQLLLTTSPEPGSSAKQLVAYDPYQAVFDQWVDPRVYFLLSTGTYLLIVASAVIWVRTALRWLAGAERPPTLGLWLLWLLYAAFALQGAMSIVADRAGTLGGNLQHRSFPSFVMVAAPIVTYELLKWKPTRQLRALAATALGVLAIFAIIKSTNEPLISNKWTFYLPSELSALTFASGHLRDRVFWGDFDERISVVSLLNGAPGLITHIGSPTPALRTFLITDIVRLRAGRLGKLLPPVSGEQRLYDNGGAQIYRTRARSPFQD